MADGTPAFELPPSTKPIARAVTVTGSAGSANDVCLLDDAGNVVTTIPTGKRWTMLACFLTCNQPAAGAVAGQIELQVAPEFDGTYRTVLGLNMPATNGLALSCTASVVIPIVNAAGNGIRVIGTGAGLNNVLVVAGWSGYQDIIQR